VLGETGATVYVTGRSTVDEAAAEVTARGGHGIGGQVDLVAANAWGGYENDGWRAFSQRSGSSR
jgi:hypothetical protein